MNQKINGKDITIYEKSNQYPLFVYAIRLQVTRDYYLRRLKIFFNNTDIQSNKTMEQRFNYLI